jgi:hypothetical protein
MNEISVIIKEVPENPLSVLYRYNEKSTVYKPEENSF